MRWNCEGGGKAHAKTLRVLGFTCRGANSDARFMVRGALEIAVPCSPWLAPDTIRQIQAMSGVSRDEYIRAWNQKKMFRSPGCPALAAAFAPA